MTQNNNVNRFSLGEPNKLTQLILDDKKVIAYRPAMVQITGSITATILLAQIMFWAERTNNRFYKFREPCNHPLYKPGDSWVEELGMSPAELKGALKLVTSKNTIKKEIDTDALVWRETGMDRVTWYSVNWNKINQVISELMGVDLVEKQDSSYWRKQPLRNGEISQYVPAKIANSIYTENTTEITNHHHLDNVPKYEIADPAKKDDDDLIDKLEEMGLSKKEASAVVKRNTRAAVEAKIKEIVSLVKKGEIKNVAAYATKTFSRPIEARVAVRISAEKMALKKEESEIQQKIEFEEIEKEHQEEEIISKIPTAIIEEIISERILNNSNLRMLYVKSGLKSKFVRAEIIRAVQEEK